MPMMKCKSFVIVIVSCFFIAVNANAQASLSAGQAFEQAAMEAYEMGDYEGALAGFELALENRPGHGRLILYLASVHLAMLNGEETLNYLEQYAALGLSKQLNREDFQELLNNESLLQRYDDVEATLKANATPLGRASEVTVTPEAIPLSEGLAYDVETGDYYISSVYERKIMRLSRYGELSVFAEDLEASPMAMVFDERSRLLWMATTRLPQTKRGYTGRNKETGLMAYNRDGVRVHHFSVFPDFYEREQLNISFGDIFVAPNSDVFISNSNGNDVFRLRYGDKLQVEHYSIDDAASLQGMAMVGNKLFIMDYSTGLHSLDPQTGESNWLTIPDGVTLLGIDGLYAYGDKLIAIQNGIYPTRIIEISLNDGFDAVSGVRVLEQGHEEFSEPTNGVVLWDEFYFIANSGWAEFSDMRKVNPVMIENLAPAKIMKIKLSD